MLKRNSTQLIQTLTTIKGYSIPKNIKINQQFFPYFSGKSRNQYIFNLKEQATSIKIACNILNSFLNKKYLRKNLPHKILIFCNNEQISGFKKVLEKLHLSQVKCVTEEKLSFLNTNKNLKNLKLIIFFNLKDNLFFYKNIQFLNIPTIALIDVRTCFDVSKITFPIITNIDNKKFFICLMYLFNKLLKKNESI